MKVDTATLPEIATRDRVTLEVFAQEILPAAQPAVLRNFVTHWPIAAAAGRGPAAAIDYIRRFDSGTPVETIFGDPAIRGQFFYNEDLSGLNFSRHPTQISAALDELLASIGDDGARTVYIQSVPARKYLPGLAEANTMPLLHPAVEPRLWMGAALTVQTHFDLSDNIACVVAGRRRFTLFPPEQVKNLYPGPFELTLAGPPVSMVRLDDVDEAAFPRFHDALTTAQSAELHPGDALFIPYAWWHHVQSLEPFNILVNYWWNDTHPDMGSPFDAMLHGLLALRDLPEPKRAVWKAFFDHYVFQTDGPPVAHLPVHARGGLGEHSPQMRANMWVRLAKAIGQHTSRLIGGPPQRRG